MPFKHYLIIVLVHKKQLF